MKGGNKKNIAYNKNRFTTIQLNRRDYITVHLFIDAY
jgi:hypothetical protein